MNGYLIRFSAILLVSLFGLSLMPLPSLAQGVLGTRWMEAEEGWSGVWTRSGGSNQFDAVWTNPNGSRVSAKLTISIRGSLVTITRVQTGGQCNYVGSLAANGTSAAGTYGCDWAPGPFQWNATIGSSALPSGGTAAFGVWAYRANPNNGWDDPCNIAYVGSSLPNQKYDNNPGYRLVRVGDRKSDVDAILSFFSQYHKDQSDGIVKLRSCYDSTEKSDESTPGLDPSTYHKPASGSGVIFNNPTIGGLPLDICRIWENDCGEPAAAAYCQSRGYAGASSYTSDTVPKTRVIGDGRICEPPHPCGRVATVTCTQMYRFN